jgi:thiamine biosynthesis lipoprotein
MLAGAGMLALLVACGPAPAPEVPVLALDGRTMGTAWSLRIAAPPPGLDAEALEAAIVDRLAAINALMSTYDPDSQLSRFNEAPPDVWFEVDPELLEVVQVAAELSEASEGAFDVTVGPLVNLWGFGPGATPGADEVPTDAAVAAALARTGWRRLEVRAEPPALRKSGRLYVDLSAIAKGYGVDEIASLVAAAGAERFLAEIGGELLARGTNARGVPWQVGIEVPDATRRGLAREAIGLDDDAVATSGDYRNFFTVEGVRYSHTIDPTTGRPVTHDVASVTVVHPSAMWADGWATTLNVLGAERGLEIADERDLPVSFILYRGEDLEETASRAFADYRSAP